MLGDENKAEHKMKEKKIDDAQAGPRVNSLRDTGQGRRDAGSGWREHAFAGD